MMRHSQNLNLFFGRNFPYATPHFYVKVAISPNNYIVCMCKGSGYTNYILPDSSTIDLAHPVKLTPDGVTNSVICFHPLVTNSFTCFERVPDTALSKFWRGAGGQLFTQIYQGFETIPNRTLVCPEDFLVRPERNGIIPGKVLEINPEELAFEKRRFFSMYYDTPWAGDSDIFDNNQDF